MAQSALLIIDVQQSFEHRPFWSETELPAFQQALLELIDQCQTRVTPPTAAPFIQTQAG